MIVSVTKSGFIKKGETKEDKPTMGIEVEIKYIDSKYDLLTKRFEGTNVDAVIHSAFYFITNHYKK